MQRLSGVEGYRIVAILDETLEKLSFLGSITPDVLQHRDELSQFVGDEISRIIQEQRQLETRYEELIAQRGTLKGLANKSKYKENQAEIQDVSRALRESTKNLCRNLKDNPNIGGNLLKIQNERSKLQDLLTGAVQGLKEDGSFQVLVDQVEEDSRAQDTVAEIMRREKETTAAVKQLESDLAKEKLEHQREVAEQKAVIADLKEKLQQIKSKTTVNTKYARREARAKTNSTLRTYQQQAWEQQEKIRQLQKQKETEETVHGRTAEFLQRKQKNLVEQQAAWEQKYESECNARDAELAQLGSTRDKGKERLVELQARWEQEIKDKEEREKEAQRLLELEQLRKEEEERNAQAACKIQQMYRSHAKASAEKRAQDEKNKKGKKKKGGKGKKKKK